MINKKTSNGKIKNIKVKNSTIEFSSPIIMGILNITPDSFYAKSRFSTDDILDKCNEMIQQGADIIDVGAVSTRPGAKNITDQDELKRIIEPIKILSSAFPDIILSVDTFRANVAEKCIAAGAHIINDISGGTMDKNMFKTVAALQVPYILMHMEGTPQTMQKNPITKNITAVVSNFFSTAVAELDKLNVSNIILDPGFGFGKTLECNYELLNNLDKIRINNLPILCGISRKSMINKVLNTSPNEALTGTISLNTIALLSGANILRVHDVKEAKEVIDIFNFNSNVNC